MRSDIEPGIWANKCFLCRQGHLTENTKCQGKNCGAPIPESEGQLFSFGARAHEFGDRYMRTLFDYAVYQAIASPTNPEFCGAAVRVGDNQQAAIVVRFRNRKIISATKSGPNMETVVRNGWDQEAQDVFNAVCRKVRSAEAPAPPGKSGEYRDHGYVFVVNLQVVKAWIDPKKKRE